MTTKETITTTIRIPRALWLKLRRLQEAGKIESINQAAIAGFQRKVLDNKGKISTQ